LEIHGGPEDLVHIPKEDYALGIVKRQSEKKR